MHTDDSAIISSRNANTNTKNRFNVTLNRLYFYYVEHA